MQHRLDAAQRAIDRRGIAHVGALELDAGGRRPAHRAHARRRAANRARATSWPRASSSRRTCWPMKPAPPVSRTLTAASPRCGWSRRPPTACPRRIGRCGGKIVAREIERRDLARQDRDRLDRHRDRLAPPIGRRPAEPGAVRHHEHIARRRAHDRADVAEGRIPAVEHRQARPGSRPAQPADSAGSSSPARKTPASARLPPCPARPRSLRRSPPQARSPRPSHESGICCENNKSSLDAAEPVEAAVLPVTAAVCRW